MIPLFTRRWSTMSLLGISMIVGSAGAWLGWRARSPIAISPERQVLRGQTSAELARTPAEPVIVDQQQPIAPLGENWPVPRIHARTTSG